MVIHSLYVVASPSKGKECILTVSAMIKVFISILCCLPILFDGYYFTGGVASALLFYLYSFLLFCIFNILGRYYLLLAIPSLLFSALVTAYVLLTRSKISVNVIASILETDFHEALEFSSSRFALKYILICLSVLMSPYVLHRLMIMLKLAPVRMFSISPIFILASFFLLTGFHFADTSGDERRSVNAAGINNYFPMREIKNLERNLFQTSLVVNRYRNMDFQLDSVRDAANDTSIILVIGEAARKSSMGLYGSEYDTTPFFNRLAKESPGKIVYMSDMVSASAYTRVSVPSLISMSSTASFKELASYPSIYQLVNNTGTETVYVGNRAQNTFFDSVINAIMQDNKVTTYSNSGTDYDGDSLHALFEITNGVSTTGKLITFQLSGSHYKYDTKYPAELDCFAPEIQEAFYLSSIRYTDLVLSEIADNVNNKEKPYVIIYTSDHGEYVNDDGDGIFGHGFKQFTRNEVEVPLVFIFNDAFIKKNPDIVDALRLHRQRRVSHDNISHTVLGMLGISDGSYYDASYDVASEKFVEHERFIVDCNMHVTSLEDYSFKQLLTGDLGQPEITFRAHCSG